MPRQPHHIVVTGASRGIGASIALAFARWKKTDLPVHLTLVSRNARKMDDVAESCRSLGAGVRTYRCDLTNEDAVARMATAILEDAGVPRLVVNNAGAFEPGRWQETNISLLKRQLDVNLMSAFHVTSAFLPGMIERGSGHILFMGSVASIKGYPGGLAYCTAKHALLGLARGIREETRNQGIRVTILMPGATRTDTWDGTDLPTNRFMAPEDVATAVVNAYELSGRSVVEEMIIRPQLGDI